MGNFAFTNNDYYEVRAEKKLNHCAVYKGTIRLTHFSIGLYPHQGGVVGRGDRHVLGALLQHGSAAELRRRCDQV